MQRHNLLSSSWLGVAALVHATALAQALPSASLSRTAGAPVSEGTARIDLSQLGLVDSEATTPITATDLRAWVDASLDSKAWLGFALGHYKLRLDGRARLGSTALRPHRLDLRQLYVQLGRDSDLWGLAVGRQLFWRAAAANIDGISTTLRPLPGLEGSLFAGLSPHPITGAVDPDFMGTGLSYAARGADLSGGGGVLLQLYRLQVERLVLAQQGVWRVNKSWLVSAQGELDTVARSGLLGDLAGVAPAEQAAWQRVDLNRAHVAVRWAPAPWIDTRLSLGHYNSRLPRLWWNDWLQRERERLGFVYNARGPQGTRRSSARAVVNAHITRAWSPYALLRADFRHSDGRWGFEGRAGLKLDGGERGYGDMSYSYRRYYVVDNQTLRLRGGLDIASWLNLEGGAAVMYSQPLDRSDGRWLVDGDLGLWSDLAFLASWLNGLRAYALYQVLVEPDLVAHTGYIRLAYRLGW